VAGYSEHGMLLVGSIFLPERMLTPEEAPSSVELVMSEYLVCAHATGPGDEILNELWPHNHTGYVCG
jgi:hypothetical protein